MIKAVVFDVDGVLIDSEPLWEQSTWEYLGIKCGPNAHKKLDKKELDREVRGRTQIFISRYLKKYFNLSDSLETIINDRLKILFKLFDKHLKLAPGALPLLKLLNQHHYPMLIASSGPRKVVAYVVRRFRLKKYFKKTISGDDMKFSKPHPWVYSQAAKILSVKPVEMLVVEDSISGVQAGIRSGAKVIALEKPYTPKKYTKKASKIIKSLKQLTLRQIQQL